MVAEAEMLVQCATGSQDRLVDQKFGHCASSMTEDSTVSTVRQWSCNTQTGQQAKWRTGEHVRLKIAVVITAIDP